MRLADVMHFCTNMSAGGPIQLVALAGSNNGTQLLGLPVSCFRIKGNTLLATGCTFTDYSSLQIAVLIHGQFHLFQYHRLSAGKYC